jgi:hypothetical protein
LNFLDNNVVLSDTIHSIPYRSHKVRQTIPINAYAAESYTLHQIYTPLSFLSLTTVVLFPVPQLKLHTRQRSNIHPFQFSIPDTETPVCLHLTPKAMQAKARSGRNDVTPTTPQHLPCPRKSRRSGTAVLHQKHGITARSTLRRSQQQLY